MRIVLVASLVLAVVSSGACSDPKDPGGAFFSLQLQPPVGAVNITSVNVEVFDQNATCNGADAQGGTSLVRQTVVPGEPTSIEVSTGDRVVSAIALDGTTRVARGCATAQVSGGAHVTVALQLVEFPPVIDGPPDGPPPDGMVPGEDECATAGDLGANPVNRTVTGSTVNTTDDYTPACGTAGGGDAFWTFTLTNPSEVDISVDDMTGDHGFALAAAPCAGLAELACANAADPDALTDIPLAPGTYYVIVDANGTDAGDYTLTVNATAVPATEDCANPGTLVLGTPRTGLSAGSGNDMSGTCGAGSRDVVYALNVPDARYVRVVANNGPSTFFLSVRGECAVPASEVGCSADVSGTATVNTGLIQGDYFVWFDSNNGGGNSFSLSATTIAPPNDLCVNAITIAPGMTTGTLIAAADDTMATCGGDTGADVFYRFTLAAAKHVTAVITTTNAAVDPVLALRSVSCTGTEVACADANANATETLDVASLPAGDYWLLVDSNAAVTTTSSFTIDLTIVDP